MADPNVDPHAEKGKKTRTRILINPGYQLKYLAIIVLIGAAFVAANSAAFYGYAKVNYEMLINAAAVTDEARLLYLSELRSFARSMVAIGGTFLLLLAILAVIITHRTAGPMFRFRATIDAIRSGDDDARIQLRPSDEFQQVARSFNQLMDRIQKPSA